MKKLISTIMVISAFTLAPIVPAEASTVEDSVWVSEDYAEEYVELVDSTGMAEGAAIKPCPAGTFKVRKNTRTKKKIVNSLIAGGIGTAIGAGVGGGRGALIGLGSGAGGYLVYRYVRDSRGRCVPRYVRRG